MSLAHVRAANSLSPVVYSTRTSFSASPKVADETAGPTGGAVPNAGGAPGVCSEGLCPCNAGTAAAASKLIPVSLRNFLRDFCTMPPNNHARHSNSLRQMRCVQDKKEYAGYSTAS